MEIAREFLNKFRRWLALALFFIVTVALYQAGISGAVVSLVLFAGFVTLWIMDEQRAVEEQRQRRLREAEEAREREKESKKREDRTEEEKKRQLDIQQVAFKRAAEEKGLLKAAAEGNIEAVNLFIDSGINIDCINEKGATPLMFAVRNNHQEMARLLIERGANPNHTTTSGMTPLKLAKGAANQEMVEILEAGGALR